MAATPSKGEEQPPEVLKGFLHNLSPTRDNRFEFGLQMKRKTYRVVCFMPTKRVLFEDKEKSPLKITNFRQQSKNSSDILLNSSVEVTDCDDLDFQCADLSGPIKICDIPKCAVGQLIELKAKVTQLKETRRIPGKDLRIREGARSCPQ